MRTRLAAIATAVLAHACILGPLDMYGNETTTTEKESQSKEAKIEDDRIEDKHPAFDPQRTVSEEFDCCTVTLNKSANVTKLDTLPFVGADASLEGKLFPSRGQAIAEVSALGGELLPSMEVVNGAMKPFNDGLYAAIEIAVQKGVAGATPGKQAFLARLLARLEAALASATPAQRAPLEQALVFIAAGAILGGASPAVAPSLLAQAQAEASAFKTKAAFYARPIGFYTWNAELEGIFAQDRYFQNQFDYPFAIFAVLAAVIEQDPALTADYQAILSVYTGLTNPYASYTPLDLFPLVDGVGSLENLTALEQSFASSHPPPFACSGHTLALFPASRATDMDYLKTRYCGAAPQPDEDLLNVLIAAIRSGTLDLAPKKDAGWYDFQVHALETLLLPERGAENQHLLLTAAYKKKLIETFKSIITQTRETHVKQLETGTDLVAMPERKIDLYPKLPVEPFPTFYLRTARAYRFLGSYLQATLGATLLDSERRLLESGERGSLPLATELRQMTELLYGLQIVAAQSLGLDPQSELLPEETAEYPVESCVARARSWLASWRENADILADPRVIVPVWNSSTTKTFVYWAILGVKVIKVQAEFVKDHEPKFLGGDRCTLKQIVPKQYYLLMEQTEQVRTPNTSPPPTREEFRKLCDTEQSKEKILEALAKGG